MKKSILLLLLTVVFIGCSSDDSGGSNTNNSFNPPSWILGKWMDSIIGIGCEFKEDDFCYITTTGITTCFKSVLDTYNGTDVNTQITEEKSDTHYKVSVTIQGSTYNYHFVKISDTAIKEIITDPDGNVPYYRVNSDGGNNPPPLPISLDFTNLNLPENSTSLVINGVTIRTSYITNFQNFQCVDSNNEVIDYFHHGITDSEYSDIDQYPVNSGLNLRSLNGGPITYHGLIFELNLPSVQKIKLSLHNECCGYIYICTENSVIIQEMLPSYDVNPEREIELNVGGQKVDKLYVFANDSSWEVIYSLDIE